LVAVPPIARAVETPHRTREKAIGRPISIEITKDAKKTLAYKATIIVLLYETSAPSGSGVSSRILISSETGILRTIMRNRFARAIIPMAMPVTSPDAYTRNVGNLVATQLSFKF
jgi:hypothetical protein